MKRFLLFRVGSGVVAIVGATVLAFVLLRLLPADPARLVVGQFAGDEAVQAQREALHLDAPLYEQYYVYVSSLARGDLGYSYSVGQPVADQLTSRLPATIELSLYAFAFAFGLAVLFALLVTYRQRRGIDRALRITSYVGLGTPPFVLGLLALIVLSEYLGVLPGPEGRLASGSVPPPSVTRLFTVDALLAGDVRTFIDAVVHLILPAAVLGFTPWAFLTRLLRANLLDVSSEPYLTMARSKGFTRWTVFRRHALPNAFLPTLTVAGLILGQFLAGSVLVEILFQWPGVGALVVESVLAQDYAVVQAFILLSAVVYVVVNMAVDVLYGAIDPRTRVVGAK